MGSVGAGDLTMCSGRYEDWGSAGASGPPPPLAEMQERLGAKRGEVEIGEGGGGGGEA